MDEQLRRLLDLVSDLRADIAALRAIQEASIERHGSEIGAIFEKLDRHEGRIGEIERTYVRVDAAEMRYGENREEHQRFAEQLASLSAMAAKWVAIAGVASTVLGVGANALVAWATRSLG